MKTVPCPKCGRSLAPAGELTVLDSTFPVYTCDECVFRGDFLGQPLDMDLPLTFCINSAGRPFDPATGEEFNFPPPSPLPPT
jgi:hypothetical protein